MITETTLCSDIKPPLLPYIPLMLNAASEGFPPLDCMPLHWCADFQVIGPLLLLPAACKYTKTLLSCMLYLFLLDAAQKLNDTRFWATAVYSYIARLEQLWWIFESFSVGDSQSVCVHIVCCTASTWYAQGLLDEIASHGVWTLNADIEHNKSSQGGAETCPLCHKKQLIFGDLLLGDCTLQNRPTLIQASVIIMELTCEVYPGMQSSPWMNRMLPRELR